MHTLAMREQRTGDAHYLLAFEQPLREIDKMRAQIDNAATARQGRIVEPGLVRSVSIVEHEISGVDGSQLATTHEIMHLAHAADKSIGEVDTQQPVRPPCGCDYSRCLTLRPAERFLAEDCDTPLERCDGLFGMESARCCDHNPIKIRVEELVERCTGTTPRELAGCRCILRVRVTHADYLCEPVPSQGLQPMAADPAYAKEAKPRSTLRRRHTSTRALRKPSGRFFIMSNAWSS